MIDPSHLVLSPSPDPFAALWEEALRHTARALFSLAPAHLNENLRRALLATQRCARKAFMAERDWVWEVLGAPSNRALIYLLSDAASRPSPEWCARLCTTILFDLGRLGAGPQAPLLLPATSPLFGGTAPWFIAPPQGASLWQFEPQGGRALGGRGQTLGQWQFTGPAEPPKVSGALTATTQAWPVEGGLRLALFDHSPLAAVEAHPEKSGSQVDLGGHSPEQWSEALRHAAHLVRRSQPALAQEISLAIRDAIPVGYHEEQHLSASYAEALGAIYLSLHPQPLTMMEALVHEFQHNKLNALSRLDPLLHNAWAPLYSSPVRPDPRPLMGVLLAAHAFVPVAEVYFGLAASGALESQRADFWPRLSAIIEKNRQACHTLQHAEPTQRGAELLSALFELEQSQRARLEQSGKAPQ